MNKNQLKLAEKIYSEWDSALLELLRNAYTRHKKGKISLTFYDRMHKQISEPLFREISKLLEFRDDYEFWLYRTRFEKRFARMLGARHAAGTHSGTAALQLTLAALGIGDGDEVITAPNSYIATALAVSNVGARPVFADIGQKTYNIDPDNIEDLITGKTRAIIPVHLFGLPAEMDQICRIARRHGLPVIEDACQAHGARYHGKPAGTIGDAGCFSFFTGKNLGGLGNGGIAVSNKKDLIRKIRSMRDPEYTEPRVLSARRTPAYLDAIQTAFLSVKLPYLNKWNSSRRENASLYGSLLQNTDINIPHEPERLFHVYQIYAIMHKRRDKLKKFLAAKGIPTRVEYPPIHLNRIYRYLGYKQGDLPVAEALFNQTLSLPMSQFLMEDEIRKVAGALIRCCRTD
jgi:dTDP-4-amino-4,6-dideoxygalactose transaminase